MENSRRRSRLGSDPGVGRAQSRLQRETRPGTVGSQSVPIEDDPTQIIPIILGDAKRAVDVSRTLFAAGFLIPAIRPPTVPKGTSRLRVSLSAAHDQADMDRFVNALREAM